MDESYHKPVLLDEVIDYLVTNIDGIYVDCTLGGGGHTLRILEVTKGKSKVVGFDDDIDAIKHVEQINTLYKDSLILINDNFVNLRTEISKLGYINKISGFLFDLGVSSFQLDNKYKGFTYREDVVLDMRMNKNKGISASEVLNTYSEKELERVFRDYGEEKKSKLIAKRVVEFRKQKLIKTSDDFVNILKNFYHSSELNKNLSRIFQALRIEVNNELENLSQALKDCVENLITGGRIVVISYHSLEDRIVKNFFRDYSRKCSCPPNFPKCMCGAIEKLKIITKKPIIPKKEELFRNIRSRSAKLRVAEKI